MRYMITCMCTTTMLGFHVDSFGYITDIAYNIRWNHCMHCICCVHIHTLHFWFTVRTKAIEFLKLQTLRALHMLRRSINFPNLKLPDPYITCRTYTTSAACSISGHGIFCSCRQPMPKPLPTWRFCAGWVSPISAEAHVFLGPHSGSQMDGRKDAVETCLYCPLVAAKDCQAKT